jgi:hypothetical protein
VWYKFSPNAWNYPQIVISIWAMYKSPIELPHWDP